MKATSGDGQEGTQEDEVLGVGDTLWVRTAAFLGSGEGEGWGESEAGRVLHIKL